MRELIAGSMRLHEPFANQPLAISQHGEKASLICIHPLSKAPVLLERRGVSNVARANEWIEHAVYASHANIRAIELFLHDNMVVTIARLESCYARLARFTLMISRPQAATRQMRDVPVVFHSQWFSSFFHGESTCLVDNPKPMQCPFTHPRRIK